MRAPLQQTKKEAPTKRSPRIKGLVRTRKSTLNQTSKSETETRMKYIVEIVKIICLTIIVIVLALKAPQLIIFIRKAFTKEFA